MRGSPRPARAGSNLVGRGIANPQEFAACLKAQNKRNLRQIICYAQTYSSVLQTGDASVISSLSSDALRRHAMEALAALANYQGCYDRWQQIRKNYSLKWTSGDESLKALQRFFNPSLSLDHMMQKVREMIHTLPPKLGSHTFWSHCWFKACRDYRSGSFDK